MKMGTYRRVDVRVWNDPKFRALDAVGKLVFLNAVTTPAGNLTGVYFWSDDRVAKETGLTLAEVRKAIRSEAMTRLVLLDEAEQILFVRSFYGIQAAGAKCDSAARDILATLPGSSVAVRAFSTRYSEVGFVPEDTLSDTPCDTLSDTPSDTPSDTLFPQEQEQEQDQEQEQQQDRTKSGIGYLPTVHGAAADPASTAVAVPPKATPEGLAELWATECPDLPQTRAPLANGLRQTLAAAIRRERGRNWRETFRRVTASRFLSGGTAGLNGREPFRADLAWVVGRENLVKLDSGRYDERSGVSMVAPSIPQRTQSNRANIAAGAAAAMSRLGGAS